MKLLYNICTAVLAAILLTACGSGDSFRINGKIDGLGTRNLRFYYYDGNTLQVGLASAINNEFYFEGKSEEPTLVTITTNQTNILGYLIAENGDDIQLEMSVNDNSKLNISGNKDAKKLFDFINENNKALSSKDVTTINSIVEKYIAANPDDKVSSAVFAIYYDSNINPAHADSVLMSITEKARPSQFITGYQSMLNRFESEAFSEPIMPLTMFCDKDSMATFNPKDSKYSILIFSEGISTRHDSVKAVIDSIGKLYNSKKLTIVNIGLEQDTATWKNTLREEPMAGLNLWMPGGVASPVIRKLNISHTPTFIVCDSIGRQIYRGRSLTAACDTISLHDK